MFRQKRKFRPAKIQGHLASGKFRRLSRNFHHTRGLRFAVPGAQLRQSYCRHRYRNGDIAHNSLPENADSGNIYISGDNLDALKHLLKSYSRKVKCIYIDPPYNTGNDGFVYHDNFNFSTQELENKLGVDSDKAQRILDLTSRRSSSHSAWLTFMASRLFLARDLLTDDGVIFISIDDNEQANLKLLCDSIFGEENFVAQFNWRKKTGANDEKDIAKMTEYIICYSKSKELSITNNIWNRDETTIKNLRYNLSDEFVEERGRFYYDTLDRGGLQYSDSLNYGIKTPDGGIIFPNGRDKFVNDGWIWKWSKDKIEWGLKNKFLEFVLSNKSTASKYTIKYKVYEYVDNEGKIREKKGRVYSNLILSPINQQGNSDIKDIFNNQVLFSNPKPINLIKYLINTIDTEDSIILDFFSGSATTAQAVMQLNANDKGKRKFIMVQIAEETPEGSPARNAGYTTIDQIGMERIKRAAKKIREENPLFAGKMDLGFKHFTLQGVETNTLDRLTAFVPEPALTDDDILRTFGKETVLATWLVNDNYGFTAKPSVLPLAQYTAYTIDKHIYLLEGQNFEEDSVVALVNKYFNEPAFNPTEIVAFGYSFNYNQIEMLRKNINILQHGNKNLQVELHIRY